MPGSGHPAGPPDTRTDFKPARKDSTFDADLASGATRTDVPGRMTGIFGKIDTRGWHRTNRMACCRCLVSLLLVDCGRKHAIDIQGPARLRRVRRPTKSCLSPPRRLRAETRNRHSWTPRAHAAWSARRSLVSLLLVDCGRKHAIDTFIASASPVPGDPSRSAGIVVFATRPRLPALAGWDCRPGRPAYARWPGLSRCA